MNCRRVLLIQLPIPPLGPQPIRGNVPLAAGYLKLFAEQRGLGEHFDITILPADDANRLGDQQLIAEIVRRDPWLLGFTCYLWNIDCTPISCGPCLVWWSPSRSRDAWMFQAARAGS